MTNRERMDAQEQRERLFKEAGWRCQECGESIYSKQTPQLAHRIAKTKNNLEKYGKGIIHHPLNLVPVCCLRCNDRQNIGFNPGKIEILLQKIKEYENGKEN